MTSLIMDSPALQSTHLPSSSRQRSNNSFSTSVDPRGAIQKRHSSSANDRARSISVTQADRLYRLASEQQSANHRDLHHHDSIQPAALGVQWITPQHSPQLSGFAPEPSIEPFPQWTAPTPPRSDSGIPNVALDSDEPVTTGISGAQDFAFEQPASSAEMSSLGFLLPTTYGGSPYDSDPSNYTMDQNYIPPMRSSQPPSTSGSSAYAVTASSSPSLYQSRMSDAGRRPSEMPPTSNSTSPYAQDYRRTSNPYEGAGYSVAPSQTIPSISGLTQSPLPSPHMGSTSQAQPMPQYATRSPSMYETSMYGSQSGPYTTAPPTSQMYAPTSAAYPPAPGSERNDSSIRVLNQRPKPQCWEHGCNGRQFSTFSNLLRHQREKSGTAAKSYCPKCGAEFTRTTARNGHLAHDKCTKQRRPSDAGK